MRLSDVACGRLWINVTNLQCCPTEKHGYTLTEAVLHKYLVFICWVQTGSKPRTTPARTTLRTALGAQNRRDNSHGKTTRKPLGNHSETARKPLGNHSETARKPLGNHSKPAQNHWETTRESLGGKYSRGRGGFNLPDSCLSSSLSGTLSGTLSRTLSRISRGVCMQKGIFVKLYEKL